MSSNYHKLRSAQKIVCIGNAGGGKSTLCRMLSKNLHISYHAIDDILWLPGWVAVSSDLYRKQHSKMLASKKWIIDGAGPWKFIEQRVCLADVVLYIDLPLKIHFYWALKRQAKCLFRPRVDGPVGCSMLPVTWKLLKRMWHFHYNMRPALMQLLKTYKDKVITIKTVKDINILKHDLCGW